MFPSNLFPAKFWKFLAILFKSPFKVCNLKVWVKYPPDVFQNVKTVQQRKPNLNFIRVIKIHLLIKVLYMHIWFNPLQTIFLVPQSECLLVLLAVVQLYSLSVIGLSATLKYIWSLDMKYISFANVSISV